MVFTQPCRPTHHTPQLLRRHPRFSAEDARPQPPVQMLDAFWRWRCRCAPAPQVATTAALATTRRIWTKPCREKKERIPFRWRTTMSLNDSMLIINVVGVPCREYYCSSLRQTASLKKNGCAFHEDGNGKFLFSPQRLYKSLWSTSWIIAPFPFFPTYWSHLFLFFFFFFSPYAQIVYLNSCFIYFEE